MAYSKQGVVAKFLEETVVPYDGDDCLFWPFASARGGHPRITIKRKGYQVTRIVCERQHGAPPSPKHEAAHSCGNGHLGCVAKKHLRWATRAENEADKVIDGRTPVSGENSSSAKLSESDVSRILSMRGMPQKVLAELFGVKQNTISRILSGKRWRHLLDAGGHRRAA